MTNPFWNAREKRLRALWRVLVLLLGTTAASLVAFGLVAEQPFASPLAVRLLYLILASLVLWAVVRGLDQRPIRSLGFALDAGWWRQSLAGFVVAGVLVGLLFSVFRALGWVTVDGGHRIEPGSSIWTALGVQLAFLVLSSAYEEALSRGYLIRNPAEGLNLPRLGPAGGLAAAWVISSLLFGLMHAGNPGAGWLSFANLTLFGALIAVPFLFEGSLAIPVGFHLGWNFFMGPIFGFSVSGDSGESALLATRLQGPTLWAGGGFGPEGGVGVSLALVVAAVLLFLWLRKRHPTLRPRLELADYRSG